MDYFRGSYEAALQDGDTGDLACDAQGDLHYTIYMAIQTDDDVLLVLRQLRISARDLASPRAEPTPDD